ncbi:MAG: hypothetical protein KAG53_05720 [Endozoicomonadaceae bacterium]|nr:hypothetical protein [Endozoicomonadaceae bacterium]
MELNQYGGGSIDATPANTPESEVVVAKSDGKIDGHSCKVNPVPAEMSAPNEHLTPSSVDRKVSAAPGGGAASVQKDVNASDANGKPQSIKTDDGLPAEQQQNLNEVDPAEGLAPDEEQKNTCNLRTVFGIVSILFNVISKLFEKMLSVAIFIGLGVALYSIPMISAPFLIGGLALFAAEVVFVLLTDLDAEELST